MSEAERDRGVERVFPQPDTWVFGLVSLAAPRVFILDGRRSHESSGFGMVEDFRRFASEEDAKALISASRTKQGAPQKVVGSFYNRIVEAITDRRPEITLGETFAGLFNCSLLDFKQFFLEDLESWATQRHCVSEMYDALDRLQADDDLATNRLILGEEGADFITLGMQNLDLVQIHPEFVPPFTKS